MTDQPKLIYLARRRPSIGAADFAARWRQHGRLGMSLPRWRNIWRYAQCDVVPWDAAPLPLAAGYDGVGLVSYRSVEARASHVDDADRAVMARDELETFDRPVRDCNFLAREIILRPAPEGAFKLFCFLFPRADASLETVAQCLEGARAALLDRALRDGGSGAGYVLNIARTDEAATPGGGLGCIAVDEIGFASMTLAEQLLKPALMAQLVQSQTSVIAGMRAVLTRETVLYRLGARTAALSGAEV